jgi:diguanylate cyclase (GGDEF)-like protein
MSTRISATPRPGWFARAWAELPRGRSLPESSWRIRHRAVVALLIAHAIVIGIYSVAARLPVFDLLSNISVPALGAYAASRPRLSKGTRSGIAAVSIMLTSGVVVHLMNGSIEAHFHFFAMIPVVALYEDWVPFGLAVGVVLLHHGVMGTVEPSAVYNHPDAWAHPWKFAFIHAGFFASACMGSIVNWRLHEKARNAEQSLAARMRHQAHHDILTGLPNRTQLIEHARALLSETRSTPRDMAVLLIDLDRFKEVNDVLGHAAGDELLAQVGPRLATAVRDGDVLARVGGDEFAAIIADADEDSAVRVADRLLELLSAVVNVEGIALNVDASIGIAVGPASTQEDVDALLRCADIAMYTAKRRRCGYAVYESGQDTATLEQLNLLGELRQGISNGEIVLHYQPKLGVAGGGLVGAEALARWQHPTRGLLAPAEFIDAAERTGLILPLTLHVLELAISQMRSWQRVGLELPVAVNLSPRCLAEADLTNQVLALLKQYEVPARQLTLEITENTLAHDPERALETLSALNAAGVQISIDDFGTGYSSMTYLKRLPVSELKIDRSFVAGMLETRGDEVLVRTAIDLGHNLGLAVVAEGVEDQGTLDALAAAGCDVAQGYHLGRPMAAHSFDRWLVSQRDQQVPKQRTAAPRWATS